MSTDTILTNASEALARHEATQRALHRASNVIAEAELLGYAGKKFKPLKSSLSKVTSLTENRFFETNKFQARHNELLDLGFLELKDVPTPKANYQSSLSEAQNKLIKRTDTLSEKLIKLRKTK